MDKIFKYVVNTFVNGSIPVQLEGEIIACSEDDVVCKLCSCQGLYKGGFEFLAIDDISEKHMDTGRRY